MIEKRRASAESQYESLHKRIGEVKDELYNEIEKKNDRIEEMMNDLKNGQEEHHRVMMEKVTGLEKWKWTIVGAAIVVGFLVAESEFFVRILN